MSEASYHLRSKATHNVMDTNLNIQKSQKTDEQNLSWLFSSPIFTPSTLGGKQRMKTVLGKKSLLASWELFSMIQFPFLGLCRTQFLCWNKLSARVLLLSHFTSEEKQENWTVTQNHLQLKKIYKGIGFCNCENWIQLKINQELNGKSIASLSCFC